MSEPTYRLIVGDCLEYLPLREPVDCVVTSPPYADARKDYQHVSLNAYDSWAGEWLQALRIALKPRGSILLNLGRIFRDGEERDYWIRTLRVAKQLGYAWLDTIVWHKPNALPRGGPYLTNAHEYVLWLGLDIDAYRGLDDARTPYAADTLARYKRRWIRGGTAKNIPGPNRRRENPLGSRPTSVYVEAVGSYRGNPHPAPMQLGLAEYLVRLGCPRGGTVLDPFCGCGTTLIAARRLERNSIGIEIDPAYVAYAGDWLARWWENPKLEDEPPAGQLSLGDEAA
jgi:DNA modification methylase